MCWVWGKRYFGMWGRLSPHRSGWITTTFRFIPVGQNIPCPTSTSKTLLVLNLPKKEWKHESFESSPRARDLSTMSSLLTEQSPVIVLVFSSERLASIAKVSKILFKMLDKGHFWFYNCLCKLLILF